MRVTCANSKVGILSWYEGELGWRAGQGGSLPMSEDRGFRERMARARRAARRTLNVLGDRVFWRLSRTEIKRLLERYGDCGAEGIYEIFDRYRGMGWYRRVGASQVRSEFTSLFNEVWVRQPRIVMEIGTARGGSLLAWCRLAETLAISIDLPGGIHGGGYAAPRAKLYEEFAHGRKGVKVALLREDSHQEKTKTLVSSLLQGRRIDFLFIDGDHTYTGVKRDFELWKPLVANQGMVAFHDIVDHPQQPSIDIRRFWKELRASFITREFVQDYASGFGIGVVYL
ncbi:MAG: class I SAM-dependent methyltransferase [Desulfobacteraceae bacterium]|nr:MAG: class I SAM-dependent methyltransferase [Desulfobacteraceae bacterium]